MWWCEYDWFLLYICVFFYVFIDDVWESLHDKYRLDFLWRGSGNTKDDLYWSSLGINRLVSLWVVVYFVSLCLCVCAIKTELVWSDIYTDLPQVWFWVASEEPDPETVLYECKSLCLFHYLILLLICLWCNIMLPPTTVLFFCFFYRVFINHAFKRKMPHWTVFQRTLRLKINWQTHI